MGCEMKNRTLFFLAAAWVLIAYPLSVAWSVNTVSSEELDRLKKGAVLVRTTDRNSEGILYGTGTQLIDCDFDRLWRFLTNYSIHDKYFQPVGTRKAYEITAKGDDHYTVRKLEVPFMKPQLTLLFHHDKTHRHITGRLLKENELTPELIRAGAVYPKRLEDVREFWQIDTSPFPGDRRLLVTYGLYLDHSLWIPGFIQRRIIKKSVRKVVEIAHDAMASQATF